MPTREQLQAELEQAVYEAWDLYGASCLWSRRRPTIVEPDAARSMAYTLRHEAPARARRLIERIEDLADALEPAPTDDPQRDRSAA